MYMAVMDYDASTKIIKKFAEFATQAEAGAHVSAHIAAYPNAFVASYSGPMVNAVADPVAQAITWVDDLPALKKALCTRVDADAEASRLRHITGGAGQASVYIAKAAEADAYKAAGYPSSSTSYPLLSAEATAIGQTKKQVADTVIARRDACTAVNASIEGSRIAGKDAINSASDRAAAEAAHDTATSALAAL